MHQIWITTLIRKLLTIVFLSITIFCAFAQIVQAQNTENPFDLKTRLPPAPPQDSVMKTGNPFDLVAPVKTPVFKIKIRPATEKPAVSPVLPSKKGDNKFRLVITLVSLLLLTIFAALFRPVFNFVIRGAFNAPALNAAFRDRQNGRLLPYLLLYFLFFLNVSILFYLLLEYYGAAVSLSPGMQILVFATFWAGLLALKHLVLTLLGFLFPIEKEIRFYSFIIMIFNLLLGLALTPVNLLIAFGPEKIIPYIIWLTLAFLGFVYLLRTIRGLFIANRFLFSSTFHFLLYICTVEITPVLVLYKWSVTHLL